MKKRKQIPCNCLICNKHYASYVGLASHLRFCHNISSKDYFDKYIEPFQHLCQFCCKEETKFINLRIGYNKSCCKKECSDKASKLTKFINHGDENYNNRKQFKETILNKSPEEKQNAKLKYNQTRAKHLEDDPLYLEKIKQKSLDTRHARYNGKFESDESIQRRKETNKQKFGVENPFQAEQCKEKAKNTMRRKYGVDYSSQSKELVIKAKETLYKNYGVTNPSKSAIINARKKQTTFELYGDENYRNSEKAKLTFSKRTKEQNKLSQKKREETCIKKYGVKTPLGKECARSTVSKLSKRVEQLLLNNNITDFKMEFRIITESGSYKRYDFKIGNCILELNGDYWHANPKKYKPDDILIMHHINVIAKDIWESDKLKIQLAKDNGYKVVVLWESEMKKMSNIDLFEWIQKNCL